MYCQHQTEIEIGSMIQQAVKAARACQENPTRENESEYHQRFEQLYAYFYPRVWGMVKTTIYTSATVEDIEELCDDILWKIWSRLGQFQ